MLYVLEGVVLLFEPRSGAWFYLVYSLFAGAVILTLVALRGLHSWHRGRSGRLGLAGFCASSIGLGCLAVTAVVRVATGRELLDPVFILGFLVVGVGYLLLCVVILKAGVLPRWSAPLPLVGVVGAILLRDKYGAGVVMGVAWALMGYVLVTGAREGGTGVETAT